MNRAGGLVKCCCASTFAEIGFVSAADRRQRLVLLVRGALFAIDGQVAGETHRGNTGAENIRAADDLQALGLEFRGANLAGDEAIVDQLVELELVCAQMLLDRFRIAPGVRGADCFVRFLGAGLGLEEIRFVRHILLAIFVCDQLTDLFDRVRIDANAVGTHVGDQTFAAALQFDTFVKLLRDAHCAPGRPAQLACGVLLHCRCRERRKRAAVVFPRGDLADTELLAFEIFLQLECFPLISDMHRNGIAR